MASDKTESFFVTSHVISLIAKLLDTKKNVYATNWAKIFATWKPDMIRSLDLDKHILAQKVVDHNAGWFIIDNYLSYKNLSGNKVEHEHLLRTEEAIEEFIAWQEKKLLKNNETDQNKNSKSVLINPTPIGDFMDKGGKQTFVIF